MMRRVALAAAILCLAPLSAAATPFDNKPKLLLHARQVPTTKVYDRCEYGRPTDCTEASTSGILSTATGPYYWVYLVAVTGSLPNLGGFQMGIEYDTGEADDILDGKGVDVFQWLGCTNHLEGVTPGEHQWPRPGGGNQIWWMVSPSHPERCPYGKEIVTGYFYLGAYSPDTIRLTTRPIDQSARIADCSGNDYVLDPDRDLGYVTFSADGASSGCNPCVEACVFQGVPVSPATWGGIKAQFDR